MSKLSRPWQSHQNCPVRINWSDLTYVVQNKGYRGQAYPASFVAEKSLSVTERHYIKVSQTDKGVNIESSILVSKKSGVVASSKVIKSCQTTLNTDLTNLLR